MASLKQKLKSLHRRNSKRHAVLLFLVILVFLGLAATARYYALVPLRLMDSSMHPGFRENSVVWMCKIPQCLGNYTEGDIVLANMRGNESMVRKVLALPGDTIQITDKGQVSTPRKKFRWKQEDSFIQSRTFYVPKAGDTLKFDQLNDVEQDYAIAYLREKGEHIIVKTTLMQGDREMNLDRVGATKIANRQVSLNEIDDLPWQDRFLIETQIRQSEPGNATITLKRQIFHGVKKTILPPPPQTDSATTETKDSSAKSITDAADTAKKTPNADTANTTPVKQVPQQIIEISSEPIQKIAITDNCYYLICNKGSGCPDSRETGYVTVDKINGKYVEWPTRIDNAIVSPAFRYINAGVRILSETFDNAVDAVSGLFTKIRNFFSDDEEKKDDKDGKKKDLKKANKKPIPAKKNSPAEAPKK